MPPKRKMAEVHHGSVTGNTWTLSRLHTEVMSGLIALPVNLSPFEPFYLASYLSTDTAPQYPQAPAQYIVSHTGVHCCDAPIETSLPVKSPFWSSNLTGLVLVHHCKKGWLTSNKAILKIKLHSTIKSIEFQKRNKNSNKCDNKKNWSGRNWKQT